MINMLNKDGIDGLLLDSGDVLIRPKAGEWFPGAAVRNLLAEHGIADIPVDRLQAAMDTGMAYLDANHSLQTEEEEEAQFERYTVIVLGACGVSDVDIETIRRVRAIETAMCEWEPFPDTLDALRRFQSRGLRLGLVSNAWPSLERRYIEAGLRDFFDPFVLSAYVGCFKPDERIFRKAVDESGIPPERLLFVDDVPDYVEADIALGMRGVVMARYPIMPDTELTTIRNLRQLEELL
jgi:putative hydrolase of the HAD superfamily